MIFNYNKTSTKEQLYSEKHSFMFLVVTLEHLLKCYEVEFFAAGAGVVLSPPLELLDDWWFATTQTKGKKKQEYLLEIKKALHQ